MSMNKLFAVLFSAGSLFFFAGMANAQPKPGPQHQAAVSHQIHGQHAKPAPAHVGKHHVAPAHREMRHAEFNALLRAIEMSRDSREAVRVVNNFARDNYFSVNQVEQILRRIHSERDRMDAAYICYYRVVDSHRWNDIYANPRLLNRHEFNRRVHR